MLSGGQYRSDTHARDAAATFSGAITPTKPRRRTPPSLTPGQLEHAVRHKYCARVSFGGHRARETHWLRAADLRSGQAQDDPHETVARASYPSALAAAIPMVRPPRESFRGHGDAVIHHSNAPDSCDGHMPNESQSSRAVAALPRPRRTRTPEDARRGTSYAAQADAETQLASGGVLLLGHFTFDTQRRDAQRALPRPQLNRGPTWTRRGTLRPSHVPPESHARCAGSQVSHQRKATK